MDTSQKCVNSKTEQYPHPHIHSNSLAIKVQWVFPSTDQTGYKSI